MAFCGNCGNQVNDSHRFCTSCGTALLDGTASLDGTQIIKAPPVPVSSTEKAGKVRKCPSCGESAPSMTANCPSCGHEFNSLQVSATLKTFFEKLETIKDEKEKLSFISGYPIPNTKEDILEFTIMAASHIKPLSGIAVLGVWYLRIVTLGIIHRFWKGPEVLRFNKVWYTKIKQAYSKGRIAFGNDKTALSKIEEIMNDVEREQEKNRKNLVIILLCIIAFYILLGALGLLMLLLIL